MTREEAIKLIDDRMCFGRGKWSDHHMPEIDAYWQAGQMAIKALEEPRWIPCSERLPDAEYGGSDNVLATCGYRDFEDGSIRWIRTLYFNGGNWCYPTGEPYLEKVYAWMPMPEPWKKGE